MRLAALTFVLAGFGATSGVSLLPSLDALPQQSPGQRGMWGRRFRLPSAPGNLHQTFGNLVTPDADNAPTIRQYHAGAQFLNSPFAQANENGSNSQSDDAESLQPPGSRVRQAKAPAPLAPRRRAIYPLRPGPQNVLTVEVGKTGFLRGRTHVFVVQRFTGRVEYDPAQPALSRVELDAEASGVSSSDTWLNRTEWKRVMEYSMSPAVLDAMAHPLISFRSTAIEPTGPGRFRVTGQLALRGRTLPCSFDTALKPRPGGALDAEGTAVFPMSRYGIAPYKEFWGLIGTRDEIRVRFQFHLVPEKP